MQVLQKQQEEVVETCCEAHHLAEDQSPIRLVFPCCGCDGITGIGWLLASSPVLLLFLYECEFI